MNRFLRRPFGDVGTPDSAPPSEPSFSPSGAHGDDHYTLFAPHHFEPDYPYPLLVWLHGPGDDERQLRNIVKHISVRNFVAAGPRGCCAAAAGLLGYEWGHDASEIAAAEQQVFDTIERAGERYRVAEDRLFLAGYQCGGSTALRIALRHPERFAGAISIGGPFPTGDAPLSQLRRIRRLPMLIIQGRLSAGYPPDVTHGELRLFHAAGLHVTVRQYPCGDELTTKMLHDMHVWMMEQMQGEAAVCGAA
jgi:phospholipase/carboxylesterase